MRLIAFSTLLAMIAAPLMAEPLDERTAKRMLFKPKGYSVEYPTNSGLSDAHLGVIKVVAESRDSKKQFGRVARYYGAIAISPSVFEKAAAALITSPETVPFDMSSGLHSPSAAAEAALNACNAKVEAGWEPCVVAANILPKRWKDVDFSMSNAATANFKLYRNAKSPKAFAISASGPGFGLAEGEDAVALAIEACEKSNKSVDAKDCTVVVQD